MFQWDKSINAINVPASKVVNLFRSMRDVQLALPGISAQLASAFLCQYQLEDGFATIAAFHLHKSNILAFYCSNPRVVPAKKIDGMLDQGLNFVESMGFLMTDQDLHLLDDADQEMLWASLPLAVGLQGEAGAAPAKKPAVQPDSASVKPWGGTAPQQKPTPATSEVPAKAAMQDTTSAPAVVAAPDDPPVADVAENVDDLLAAVEAMRNNRPGLRARKSPPSVQEIAERRLQLCQTVGRILASL